MNSAESADGKREYGAGKEALIVGEPQDAWSGGIIQESILVKGTTITTLSGNVGAQFEITGTYKGKRSNSCSYDRRSSSNLGELSITQ